jgi:hypothetical protein
MRPKSSTSFYEITCASSAGGNLNINFEKMPEIWYMFKGFESESFFS